jgi:hypothetical protein
VTDVTTDSREDTLPAFLPDGRHFLSFTRPTLPENGDDNWVTVHTLGSTDERRLVSTDSQALYSDSGHLFFLRGGALMAQRFDASTLLLEGEPMPISGVDQVGFNPGNLRAMFSVSHNGVIVFRRAVTRELTWFDRHGQRLSTLANTGLDQEPTLSPDGQHVAVSRLDPATASRRIWILNAQTGTGSRLTGNALGTSPSWSFDGRSIIFECHRQLASSVCAERVGSSGEVTSLPDARGTPMFATRDGRIVYQSARTGKGAGLGTSASDFWVVRADGSASPTRLTETSSSEHQGQLSPDGRWLAYASNASGREEVYVRSFPTGEIHRISSTGGIEPRWRGDGRELFWLAADRWLMSVPIDGGLAFHAGPPTPLFQTLMDPTGRLGIIGRNQYDVSADGQRFLINQPRTREETPITVVANWRPATH